MAFKRTMVGLLLTFALVHGRNVKNSTSSDLSIPVKEGRTLIEVPVIGTILLVTFKLASLVISKALSLMDYKWAVISFVRNIASWVYENYMPLVLGTAVVVGLCWSMSTDQELADHRLIQAARSLDQGYFKFQRVL